MRAPLALLVALVGCTRGDDVPAPAIAAVLAANPAKVAEYRGGKAGLLGFFVGQVMKASGGKANPASVNQLVAAALSAG